MTAKKKKKGGGIFWKLLFLVALCVFCFSMYQLVNIYLGYKKGVDEYHAVAEATTVQSSEPLEVVEENMQSHGVLQKARRLTKFTVHREMPEFLNMQSVCRLVLWNLKNLLILQENMM